MRRLVEREHREAVQLLTPRIVELVVVHLTVRADDPLAVGGAPGRVEPDVQRADGVAGDQARIDGADRGANDPIGLDSRLVQRLVDAGLVGAEGTAALEDPEWTARAIAEHGDRIAVGLDVKGTTLAARGWTQEGGDLWETLGRLDAAGCARYVVTDVAKDGTMKGPNLHLLKQVCEATDRPVVASGGIARLEDLHKLADMVPLGIEGAIVGRALYDGAFTLFEALAAVEPRYDPYEWGPPQP